MLLFGIVMERELFGRVLQLCNSALVALAVPLKLEVGQFYDGQQGMQKNVMLNYGQMISTQIHPLL